ncbi:hypothetical protein [Epilithonimonas zeae]|uniref:hypothetical protein n=1 Tax=Epilithonimonas zeae TaxID=1416779 RepID=UPI0020100C4E|nr:hypothetical protein [Epilithonimonas zeae]UQB69230.1 hypothetical protein KI430_02015 [Epilithonimonas zeae]
MKKHKRFLKTVFVVASVLSGFVQGQAFDQELNFKGSVKTLTLEKQNDSDKKQKLVTIFEYDKNQRKLKEISPYNSNTDYFYLNKSDTKPTFTKWYGTDNSRETSIEIEDKNKTGKMLLSGTLKSGKWDYYFIHDYTSNLEKVRWFTDGEIYLVKTEEKINLDQFDIPAGFVPFDWDRKLSSGIIKKSKEYTSDRYDHDVVFEFVEKGNPKNRVTFQYHGNDVYDAGKGYWHRFENDRMIEERYIYGASEISDFGHRYVYNTDGKLKSDHYGYFNQLPNNFLQRKLYTYNENGDCIKETSDAENEKTYIINYKYTYDENKNWTSQTSIFSDGSGSTIKRKFIYYKPDESELTNSLSEVVYNQYLKELRAYKPIAEKQFENYNLAKSKKENTPADKTNYKTLRSKNWKDFLPKGQKSDTITTGDLNKDGLEDLVMVYQSEKLLKQENNTVRTLRILLKQNDGNYQLAAESKGAVVGENMNNTFFSGLEIKKGLLIINHEYIRGGSVHKYRFQNGGFYLIGAESRTGDASYYSSIDYNLSTGKYISIYDNSEDNKDLPKSSKKEGVKKLTTLPNIETYEIYSLEVDGHMF